MKYYKFEDKIGSIILKVYENDSYIPEEIPFYTMSEITAQEYWDIINPKDELDDDFLIE